MAIIKSDEELRKSFKIFVDKEDIVRGAVSEGMMNSENSNRQAELIEETLLKIFNKNPQKRYKTILDLLPLGKGKIYTSGKHRKIWARLASNKQIKKCAVVGSSMFLKVIAAFVIRLSGRSKDIKWFSNKEKANSWLKED